ncbi:hypothetical protein GDI3638 [Gluconacetobacter diazotrophicus PA1 5]|uniref:Uncharacterized protein n=1 Tax=Gluconacetobacter diazotrophicus (strain ATCC 49037 / DSM 5601 / CCUG 37298 / CIP 103539 / LMG 7603 / PAl5) TaxID=272568 RepID=A9H713_GLUDA|nr:hypothetical protein GDI3638 [Gluconacetobacter diazotrophicus PA1 5]
MRGRASGEAETFIRSVFPCSRRHRASYACGRSRRHSEPAAPRSRHGERQPCPVRKMGWPRNGGGGAAWRGQSGACRNQGHAAGHPPCGVCRSRHRAGISGGSWGDACLGRIHVRGHSTSLPGAAQPKPLTRAMVALRRNAI